jgi:hypothetical protein
MTIWCWLWRWRGGGRRGRPGEGGRAITCGDGTGSAVRRAFAQKAVKGVGAEASRTRLPTRAGTAPQETGDDFRRGSGKCDALLDGPIFSGEGARSRMTAQRTKREPWNPIPISIERPVSFCAPVSVTDQHIQRSTNLTRSPFAFAPAESDDRPHGSGTETAADIWRDSCSPWVS